MLPTSGAPSNTGVLYNIVELPVTLTLSPLNQIACDYNALDEEMQEALNKQCMLVSKGTKSGGPFGTSFIDLLKSAATCVSTSVTQEEQISVLQQAIAAAQVAQTAEKQKEYEANLSQLFENHAYCWPEEEELCSCIEAYVMRVLPSAIHTLILEQVDERLLARTCSFFRRSVATNNVHLVATTGLEKLLIEKDLLWDRCGIAMSAEKRIALTVIRGVSLGWTERTYQACLRSPAIREIGKGDIYGGISEVLKQCISQGHVEVLSLADAAPNEQIKIRILAPCISALLDQKCYSKAFEIACQLSDTKSDTSECDGRFFGIILKLMEHGESENPIVMECLEKIVDAKKQAQALDLILKSLLKAGKSEKALLIAPRAIACTQRFPDLRGQTWQKLIRFFMEEDHLDLNRAFALIPQLDLSNTDCFLAFALAGQLIEQHACEEGSYLVEQIFASNNNAANIPAFLYRRGWVFAKIGEWKKAEDVIIQLGKQGSWSEINLIISELLTHENFDEAFAIIERVCASVLRDANPSVRGYIEARIAVGLANNGKWDAAWARAEDIEHETYRESALKQLRMLSSANTSDNS